ncbi:hypothetical protein TIFTF001_023838 [Ficus carica]|uniref:Uncharacterized protein n=1 Tax=Ficus carica TaxID=3494 RepID=A0AA88AV88_FICCA|nr:hypothetical protein TIFTF001_023838 [Ficus carica]
MKKKWDCFRQLSGVFSNRLFIFFLCHVILLYLMANSGQFSGHNRIITGNTDAELHGAVVKNCKFETTESESGENDAALRDTDEMVYMQEN